MNSMLIVILHHQLHPLIILAFWVIDLMDQ